MTNKHLSFGGDVFVRLKNQKWFVDFIRAQYGTACSEANITPTLDNRRLWDALGLWQEDLDRLVTYELNGGVPDHFKQSGHLVYWLRRSSPVIAMKSEPGKMTPAQKEFHNLLMRYGNEYLAFDLGYRVCRFFEAAKEGLDEEAYSLTADYLVAMSHFLKTKNVSPHALYMVFKSLFMRC